MTRADRVTWAREFSPYVRDLIVGRDRPLGAGLPWCVACGEPVRGVVHVHHILFKGRGGDGRPSNGIVVHGEGEGEGCHKTRIHDNARTAQSIGLARSQHSHPEAVYRLPLMCAYRGWIILDDVGGWRPALPNELKRH
jgi:hypothetical protein